MRRSRKKKVLKREKRKKNERKRKRGRKRKLQESLRIKGSQYFERRKTLQL
jgi:hypothetical protein